MANTKISELTTASVLTGSEVLPVVQSATTKKVTRDAFVTGGIQSFVVDQYNGGVSQTGVVAETQVDLTDMGGSLTADYYNLPSGWTVTSGTNLYVPDGFYIVQMYMRLYGHEFIMEMYADGGGLSGTNTEYAYAKIVSNTYMYGSGTWHGRLTSAGGIDPSFRFLYVDPSPSGPHDVDAFIRITRLGD